MHSHLDQNTRHGGTDLAAVAGVGLDAADILDGSLVVDYGHLADFTVHLKEDFTLASVLAEGTDSKELEN